MSAVTDGFAVVAKQRRQLKDDELLCDDLEALLTTLPDEHGIMLREHAVEISRGIRSAVVGLISAGNALLKTRAILSADEWTRYAISVTGGRSTRWCEKAIEAFEFAQAHPDIDLTRLTVGAVFELSAPSTPVAVVEQVAQRVAQNDPPTKEQIQTLKDSEDSAQRVAPVDHDVDRTSQAPQIEPSGLTPNQGKKLLMNLRHGANRCLKDGVPPRLVKDMLDGLSGEVLSGAELIGLDEQTILDCLRNKNGV